MKNLLLVITLVLGVSAMGSGDAKRGAMIYASKTSPELKAEKVKAANCIQCHKKDGMGQAKKKDGKYKLSVMKGSRIAGLDEQYIFEQLTAIQKKTRKTKYTSTMQRRIKKYSEQDLRDLAAYVSKVLNPSAGEYKSTIWPREK